MWFGGCLPSKLTANSLARESVSEDAMAKLLSDKVLSDKDAALIDAYWRAANYLSVGQIYLFDNPLLREPLKDVHIKPRLLGHWGTTPGLNSIYVHLNRLIKKLDLDMIYVTGPGHGGQELIGVPARRERAGLGFAVPDHAGDDEVGIAIRCGTEPSSSCEMLG